MTLITGYWMLLISPGACWPHLASETSSYLVQNGWSNHVPQATCFCLCLYNLWLNMIEIDWISYSLSAIPDVKSNLHLELSESKVIRRTCRWRIERLPMPSQIRSIGDMDMDNIYAYNSICIQQNSDSEFKTLKKLIHIQSPNDSLIFTCRFTQLFCFKSVLFLPQWMKTCLMVLLFQLGPRNISFKLVASEEEEHWETWALLFKDAHRASSSCACVSMRKRHGIHHEIQPFYMRLYTNYLFMSFRTLSNKLFTTCLKLASTCGHCTRVSTKRPKEKERKFHIWLMAILNSKPVGHWGLNSLMRRATTANTKRKACCSPSLVTCVSRCIWKMKSTSDSGIWYKACLSSPHSTVWLYDTTPNLLILVVQWWDSSYWTPGVIWWSPIKPGTSTVRQSTKKPPASSVEQRLKRHSPVKLPTKKFSDLRAYPYLVNPGFNRHPHVNSIRWLSQFWLCRLQRENTSKKTIT